MNVPKIFCVSRGVTGEKINKRSSKKKMPKRSNKPIGGNGRNFLHVGETQERGRLQEKGKTQEERKQGYQGQVKLLSLLSHSLFLPYLKQYQHTSAPIRVF
jgi:hypothetical protein